MRFWYLVLGRRGGGVYFACYDVCCRGVRDVEGGVWVFNVLFKEFD